MQLTEFVAARMDEADATETGRAWPAVSFGIAESSFNSWDVREFRNGFFRRTVATSLPKREAQLLRDKHIAALYSDHPDYSAEWAPASR